MASKLRPVKREHAVDKEEKSGVVKTSFVKRGKS